MKILNIIIEVGNENDSDFVQIKVPDKAVEEINEILKNGTSLFREIKKLKEQEE